MNKCASATPATDWLQMQGRLLLRASFRSSVHPTCVKGAAETRLQQQSASVRQAHSQATNGTGGGSQSSFNRKQFILYPAAAVIALTSVAAAKAHQQPLLDEEHQHSSLLDAQWVQRIPQQQNVLQVLSAKSLDTHPLLTKDHIVSTVQYSANSSVTLSTVDSHCWCSSQPFCEMDSSRTWCASMILWRRSIILFCSLAGATRYTNGHVNLPYSDASLAPPSWWMSRGIWVLAT